MKRIILIVVIFFTVVLTISARVIKVDINGSWQFTTISAALNASVNGDTIKVLPGVYEGAIIISKDVILIGSGYETTKINSNNNPTITMNGGKIMWFAITSNTGNGIKLNSGHVTNCVIRGCMSSGIYIPTNSTGIVSNCNLISNSGHGIYGECEPIASVYNCIGYGNKNKAYYGDWSCLNVNYSCHDNQSNYRGGAGTIQTNPQFTSSEDYHISPKSPCWDTGKPEVLDPDGSRSDMGYFGGPDCPIYPVVTNIKIVPQTDGSIKIEATGVANY